MYSVSLPLGQTMFEVSAVALAEAADDAVVVGDRKAVRVVVTKTVVAADGLIIATVLSFESYMYDILVDNGTT